jgi:hypothetical protein
MTNGEHASERLEADRRRWTMWDRVCDIKRRLCRCGREGRMDRGWSVDLLIRKKNEIVNTKCKGNF